MFAFISSFMSFCNENRLGICTTFLFLMSLEFLLFVTVFKRQFWNIKEDIFFRTKIEAKYFITRLIIILGILSYLFPTFGFILTLLVIPGFIYDLKTFDKPHSF